MGIKLSAYCAWKTRLEVVVLIKVGNEEVEYFSQYIWKMHTIVKEVSITVTPPGAVWASLVCHLQKRNDVCIKCQIVIFRA